MTFTLKCTLSLSVLWLYLNKVNEWSLLRGNIKRMCLSMTLTNVRKKSMKIIVTRYFLRHNYCLKVLNVFQNLAWRSVRRITTLCRKKYCWLSLITHTHTIPTHTQSPHTYLTLIPTIHINPPTPNPSSHTPSPPLSSIKKFRGFYVLA